MRDIITSHGVRTLLDAGCGPASFLRSLFSTQIKLYGFDLTNEMVNEAKRVFSLAGHDQDSIWEGSVLDKNAYTPPGVLTPPNYEAVICTGVLPHIPEEMEETLFMYLYQNVATGGIVIIEARNALFSLFTLNRHSFDFFSKDLLQADELRSKASGDEKFVEDSLDLIGERFRMDLPQVRKGNGEDPGYDEILSRMHNPFVLSNKLESAGLKKSDLYFIIIMPCPRCVSRSTRNCSGR